MMTTSVTRVCAIYSVPKVFLPVIYARAITDLNNNNDDLSQLHSVPCQCHAGLNLSVLLANAELELPRSIFHLQKTVSEVAFLELKIFFFK